MSTSNETIEAQEADESVEEMGQLLKNVNVASEDSRPAELAASFSSTLASKVSRKNVFHLAMKKKRLQELVLKLRSSKSYICRDDRELMKIALIHWQKHSSIDASMEIAALNASTRYHINRAIRDTVAFWVEQLLGSEQLLDVSPNNDDERFDSLVDEDGINVKSWTDMQTIGVVFCNVLHGRRMMELVGTSTANDFYDFLKSQWGFENPRRYFKYSGESSIPQGKSDSSDTYVVAGSPLEVIIPLVNSYDLRNGTVGGLLFAQSTMYAVTAGHCVKARSAANTESQVQDQNSLIVTDENLDFAILPLKNGGLIAGFNPWYMDDDVYTNEEFYTGLKRLERPSFDSQSDSIGQDEDFPFIDATLLHPGTTVVKIGATTGITSGTLVGIRSVVYTEKQDGNEVQVPANNVVAVQWEQGQRFAAGGDSGSVYYAKLGSFTYPIAIHRAQVTVETPNYLESGKDAKKLYQIVSIGTPLKKVVEKFKNDLDITEVDWFKFKRL
eukprot:scaffold7211_cov247-Ochromonas_danica.AAC.6